MWKYSGNRSCISCYSNELLKVSCTKWHPLHLLSQCRIPRGCSTANSVKALRVTLNDFSLMTTTSWYSIELLKLQYVFRSHLYPIKVPLLKYGPRIRSIDITWVLKIQNLGLHPRPYQIRIPQHVICMHIKERKALAQRILSDTMLLLGCLIILWFMLCRIFFPLWSFTF